MQHEHSRYSSLSQRYKSQHFPSSFSLIMILFGFKTQAILDVFFWRLFLGDFRSSEKKFAEKCKHEDQ